MCLSDDMNGKQESKIFVGGLSWETTNDKLRAYFENFGVVREAFISVNRTSGRPRGFGFVTFENAEVAKKVIATKHTIDRREVEAKESFAKEEQSSTSQASSEGNSAKSRKVFVGGLAPAVDDVVLKEHFEQFGAVETAEVMLDHDSKRPRGFGFVTFASEESVEKVFEQGTMQTILDKQVEIKQAMPRDQMPCRLPAMGRVPFDSVMGRGMIQQQRKGFFSQPFGAQAAGYGPLGVVHPGAQGNLWKPPRGPGGRGQNMGPQQFQQQSRGGYGAYRDGQEGDLGNLGGVDMYAAYAAVFRQLAVANQQIPGYQGHAQGPNMPVDVNALHQLESSLASLNVSSGKDYSRKNAVDSGEGLAFDKPSTMGPGWSG